MIKLWIRILVWLFNNKCLGTSNEVANEIIHYCESLDYEVIMNQDNKLIFIGKFKPVL